MPEFPEYLDDGRGAGGAARVVAGPETLPVHGLEDNGDGQFVDDLVAALELKKFLIGRGVNIPPEVLSGLAELNSVFRDDIAGHRDMASYRSNSFSRLGRR